MEESTLTPSLIPELGITLPLDSIILIVFLCLLAGYIVYAVILHYHWRQYSTSKIATFWTLLAFAGCTLPLLAIAGITALTF